MQQAKSLAEVLRAGCKQFFSGDLHGTYVKQTKAFYCDKDKGEVLEAFLGV